MGWLIYGNEHVPNPEAECRRICTWDNDDSKGEVLASCLIGNTFYAASHKTIKATGEVSTLAVVFLIQRSPFGYKDMDETMGPNEASPTRAVLEALPPLPEAPVVTDYDPCWYCDGKGHQVDKSDCHRCHGAGTQPVKEQVDRYAYARSWRQRAWSQFGGEPHGKQLELTT